MDYVSPSAWEARGSYIELLGQRMFCIDEPATEESRGTIVLLHGFPTASWDWWKIWPQLNRHYRLVAMDFLGFGFSAKPRGHEYSILEQASLCEALWVECGLQSFHVLAHDYGDTVAQELLARQNAGSGVGQWLSCLFLNGGLFPETHRAVLAQRLLHSPLGPLVQRGLSRRSLARSFQHIFGDDTPPEEREIDDFYALFTRDGGRDNTFRLIRYIAERRRHRERWVRALAEACCPIGLINGGVDPVSGDHMVRRFETVIGTDHFIHRLPAIGHYPQTEAPEQVLAAYAAFLDSAAHGSPGDG